MRITDFLVLTMLAEAVGTLVLSGALIALYWRSPRLRHILPVALSYCWIAVVAAIRAFGHVSGDVAGATPVWSLSHVVCAFALGDVGLLIILSDAWPRRGKAE